MRIADWSPPRLLNLHRCTGNPISYLGFSPGDSSLVSLRLMGWRSLTGTEQYQIVPRVLKFVGPDTFSWDFVPGRMGIVLALAGCAFPDRSPRGSLQSVDTQLPTLRAVWLFSFRLLTRASSRRSRNKNSRSLRDQLCINALR